MDDTGHRGTPVQKKEQYVGGYKDVKKAQYKRITHQTECHYTPSENTGHRGTVFHINYDTIHDAEKGNRRTKNTSLQISNVHNTVTTFNQNQDILY